MNFLLFSTSLFKILEDKILEFLEANKDNLNDCEFLIPIVLNELLEEKKVKVNVLETNATWYGVTYKEDKEMVVNAINKLIEEGQYNKNLWE